MSSFIDLAGIPIFLLIAFIMATHTCGLALDQEWTAARADGFDRRHSGSANGNDIVAVHAIG